MREQYVEAVLAVAELVPPARVLSYGDIAALLESGGPRQVGAVMSSHGSAVPWWRVIRSSGAAPAGHESSALRAYREERTALRGDTSPQPAGKPPAWRVDMTSARWNPEVADFVRIDAIAAGLHEADDAGPLATAGDAELAGPSMSVPRDGLGA